MPGPIRRIGQEADMMKSAGRAACVLDQHTVAWDGHWTLNRAWCSLTLMYHGNIAMYRVQTLVLPIDRRLFT